MSPAGLEYHGQMSFMKAGLKFADHITTVSPSYAREITTHAFGCGLDGVLRARAGHFHTAQGKSAAISDLKRWLTDANLVDEAVSMMVDQAVELIREVADRIERELEFGGTAV